MWSIRFILVSIEYTNINILFTICHSSLSSPLYFYSDKYMSVFLRYLLNHLLKSIEKFIVQVNLCQKLLFLHQLTHNMTTDFSLNYKFNTWKFQAQTWGEHVVYRNCVWHSEQFLYTTCSAKRIASDKDLPVCIQIDLLNRYLILFIRCLLLKLLHNYISRLSNLVH